MNNKKLFQKYIQKISSIKEDDFTMLANDIFNGKNAYMRMTKKGSSMFDPTWIKTIEDCLYELGEIINNPREVTTQDSSIVPIELAKKVDGESVVHLASHSHLIKDITPEGEVVPGKILAHFNKEELHTYENRFIATFIRRLILFVEKRYEYIKSTISLESQDVLMIKNTSIVNGQEVEIETKVTVKKEMVDDVTVAAKEYMERVELMRQYVTYYYNSPFMKEMKTEKDVRKPILQTNIIRKNPLYHKCYEVFLFIERFDTLGVSYKIDEEYKTFDDKEREKLNYLLLGQYLSIQDPDNFDTVKQSSKTFKPKILTSMDDEKFIYGDLYEGPIEFVRIDEGYRNYLSSLAESNHLPRHPTKEEKEYYSEEYAERKNLLTALKEIDKQISRIQKDLSQYEKHLAEYIKKREKQEAEEAREEIANLQAQTESLLEEKRRLIIAAASKQKEEIIEEYGIVETDEVAMAEDEEEFILEEHHDISEMNIFDVIPGQFIVKTKYGYYIDDKHFSNLRNAAYVFEDFNIANQAKNRFGGKVIKI